MGFNKKYISEKNVKSFTDDDFKNFFNYIKSGEMLDKFSTNIRIELDKYTINDKDEIIKIMSKYKYKL